MLRPGSGTPEERLRPCTGAEWIALLYSGDATREDERQLRQWVAASERNERDLSRAAAAWLVSAVLAESPEIQAELADLRRLQPARPRNLWRRWLQRLGRNGSGR